MTDTDAGPDLKAKHRAMWALGDYPAVADRRHPAARPGPGRGLRDQRRPTGCSTSPPAPATPRSPRPRPARTWSPRDLTPELLDVGRELADRARGSTLTWEEGDAEALPYGDGAFDAVISCVGVMFAPHHQDARRRAGPGHPPRRADRADQLDARGLHRADVRDDEAVRAAAAARRAAAAAVGRRGARARRCSATGSTTSCRRSAGPAVDRFATGAEFRDFFKATYGPTIAVYRAIADDPERVAALDAALAELGRPVRRATA